MMSKQHKHHQIKLTSLYLLLVLVCTGVTGSQDFNTSLQVKPNPVPDYSTQVTLACCFAVEKSNFGRLYWMKGVDQHVMYYAMNDGRSGVEEAFKDLVKHKEDFPQLSPSISPDDESTWSSHQIVIAPTQCDADQYMCQVSEAAGHKVQTKAVLTFNVAQVTVHLDGICLGRGDRCKSAMEVLHDPSVQHNVSCEYSGLPYNPTTHDLTITPADGALHNLTGQDGPEVNGSMCDWSGKFHYSVTFQEAGQYDVKCEVMGNTKSQTVNVNVKAESSMKMDVVIIISVVVAVAVVLLIIALVIYKCCRHSINPPKRDYEMGEVQRRQREAP